MFRLANKAKWKTYAMYVRDIPKQGFRQVNNLEMHKGGARICKSKKQKNKKPKTIEVTLKETRRGIL